METQTKEALYRFVEKHFNEHIYIQRVSLCSIVRDEFDLTKDDHTQIGAYIRRVSERLLKENKIIEWNKKTFKRVINKIERDGGEK